MAKKGDSTTLLLVLGVAGAGAYFLMQSSSKGGGGGGFSIVKSVEQAVGGNAYQIQQLCARIRSEEQAIINEANARTDAFNAQGVKACSATLPDWQHFLGLGCSAKDNTKYAKRLRDQWIQEQKAARVEPLRQQVRALGGSC